jgi:hypothetical protein
MNQPKLAANVAGFGTAWNQVEFDNFEIRKLPELFILCTGPKIVASPSHRHSERSEESVCARRIEEKTDSQGRSRSPDLGMTSPRVSRISIRGCSMKASRRNFLGCGITAMAAGSLRAAKNTTATNFLDILRPPDLLTAYDEGGKELQLKPSGGRWRAQDVEVITEPKRDGTGYRLSERRARGKSLLPWGPLGAVVRRPRVARV